jgi:hypothetical protein
MKKILSYSDDAGVHSESREISRFHGSLSKALSNALITAGAPLAP